MPNSGTFSKVTLGCLLAVACSAPLASPRPAPVPTPSAAPATSQSAAPAAVASAPPPPVWTTPLNSNVCTEYKRTPDAYGPSYSTREECEKWVAERSCQPGYRCYDGCNWSGCNSRGDAMITTLLACDLVITLDVSFQAGTSKPNQAPDWAARAPQLQRLLRAPERSLRVVGYAELREAGSSAAQKQLALRRAQVVVKELAKHGLATTRMTAVVGDAEQLRQRGRGGELQRVRFELEPTGSVRDDFEPSSREYQEYCGVRSRRGE